MPVELVALTADFGASVKEHIERIEAGGGSIIQVIPAGRETLIVWAKPKPAAYISFPTFRETRGGTVG